MEIYFSEIQFMYISIFNSRFLTGGVQLVPCFVLSVPERNHGADN